MGEGFRVRASVVARSGFLANVQQKREDTILYPLLDDEPDNDSSDYGDDPWVLGSASLHPTYPGNLA